MNGQLAGPTDNGSLRSRLGMYFVDVIAFASRALGSQ